MKKNLNIKIEEELLEKYMTFCSQNGYAASKRIRNFIEKELQPKENEFSKMTDNELK